MRTFIIKFLLFILVIVSITCLLTYAVDSGLRKTEYFHYKEWNLLYQSKINADILILGNSRAYHHVNPIIVDSILNLNSFNLGMDAAQFDLQYARFMTYIHTNKKPKIILQNIDEWTLEKSSLYLREQYIPYYNDSILLSAIKSTAVLPKEYFIYPLKYMGCNRNCWKVGLLEFFGIKHYDNNKTKGFLRDWATFNSEPNIRLFKVADFHVNEHCKELFNKYLHFCQQNDIKVICFYAPLYKDGYFEDKHEKTISYYKQLLSAYNVNLIDCAKNKMSSNPHYFRNNSHLRGNGCDIFTTELMEQVDPILSCE